MKKLPLHIQLTVSVIAIVVTLSLSFLVLALWSHQNYYNETSQRMHLGLAEYIVDHQYEPLIHQGVVNKKALKQLAMHTMAINPSVEVYLIDTFGGILGHALPLESVKLNAVNIDPVLHRLGSDDGTFRVILGDNPRLPTEQWIFSVAPVMDESKLAGYLYVMLSSSTQESIFNQVRGSHISQLILIAVAALVLLAVVVSLFLLKKLTQPIRRLSSEINSFQQSDWMAGPDKPESHSEIEILRNNFYAMRTRIIGQFRRLQESSRLRRELISNISHDLRTPLASMQGYIEAVMMKSDQLSKEESQRYLGVAHKNSRRLTTLVTELFELSKLEAGQVKPDFEPFCLLELIYDIARDYELEAKEKSIKLAITSEQKDYKVVADIGLMQRVLQNLIDNALRFTPQGGEVNIALQPVEGKVQVIVADSGLGIDDKDLPYIFDAYYSTENSPEAEVNRTRKKGTGLGLAIVKKILDLHDSNIIVQSEQDKGTLFRFELQYA
ncbi:MAG: HAMP domain-containing histidine kinase [Pseudomonadales bacterium]|nr:HAMP domain-containing histidine kinase [Pseudomonadales bacterium]